MSKALSRDTLRKKLSNDTGSVKLKLRQQVQLFSIWGDLLQNGFSIREAVEFSTSLQIDHVDIVSQRLKRGMTLADALKTLINDDLYYQMVVAEQHGNLETTLIDIKKFIKFKYQQANLIKQVLAYPLFLVIILIAIILGSQWLIVPQLQQMSAANVEGHDHFPWLGGILAGGLIMIISLVILKVKQLPVLKRARILVHLPLVGNIFRTYFAYYIANNLALMIQSGLDAKAICKVTSCFDSQSLFFQLGQIVRKQLHQGKDLVDIIHSETLMPNEMALYLLKGNDKERLAQNLSALANFNFTQMMQLTKKMISWIQPIMFILIGLSIILTYMSMLMPMYNSIQGGY